MSQGGGAFASQAWGLRVNLQSPLKKKKEREREGKKEGGRREGGEREGYSIPVPALRGL